MEIKKFQVTCIGQKYKTLQLALTGGCSKSGVDTVRNGYLSSLILNRNMARKF